MQIRFSEARGILSKTSGFIRDAGFTHSLTPARNCTFACTYCYVPTMRVQAGLQPEDWRRWGQYTTFKSNAAELLEREVRPDQTIYCSPLVDPYQPAEEHERMMPRLLEVLRRSRPRVLVIQTRGTLILDDLKLLAGLSWLRVSFSLTTDREDMRRLYEPLCAPIDQRLDTMRRLRDAGVAVYATLAPLLPCDPEALASLAIEATGRDLIGDPFHVRATKPSGATTREAALRIAAHHGHQQWLDPEVQRQVVEKIRDAAQTAGKRFATGPEAFRWLSN